MADATDVLAPDADTSTEMVVNVWLKEVGSNVLAGEVIAEVTTEKVNVEVTAPTHGTLVEILVPAGSPAGAGQVIARISG